MRRARQKIEHQAFAAVLVALVERQIELHQRVEQPMFGDLDLLPGNDIVLDAGVGDGPVMPARRAITVGRIGLDHPIADVELGIGAETIELLVDRERPPRVALGLQRRQIHDFGNEAEPARTLFAHGVFKIEQLRAMLAFEKLHWIATLARCMEYVATRESFLRCGKSKSSQVKKSPGGSRGISDHCGSKISAKEFPRKDNALEHDLFGKPVPTFPDHALTEPGFLCEQ